MSEKQRLDELSRAAEMVQRHGGVLKNLPQELVDKVNKKMKRKPRQLRKLDPYALDQSPDHPKLNIPNEPAVRVEEHVHKGDWWKACLICGLPELHPAHSLTERQEK